MKKVSNWLEIGTVLGDTNINDFYFTLKNYKATKGDIVTTETKIPSNVIDDKTEKVTVWGKIIEIVTRNEFFPREAAQSLTDDNIDIRDTRVRD